MSELMLLKSFEPFEYSPDVLKESIAKSGKLVMKGIIQRADVLNQNGRIYPKSILTREIQNYQKFINERRALGEADHPDSSTISIQKVSHLMTEAYMDDEGVVHGRLEILDTPCGKIVKALVEGGVKLGISSRGVGTTRKQGDYDVVNDDFQIITFDVVVDPSTPQAFIIPEARVVTPVELRKTFTRSDRINRILTDVIDLKRGG